MIERATFLLARIAEDEAAARAAATTDRAGETWYVDSIGLAAEQGGPAITMAVVSGDGGDLWDSEGAPDRGMAVAHAEHVARWDPARVLSECDAKRRLVGDLIDHPRIALEHKRALLEIFAAPYADHPDFREDWLLRS